MKIKFIVKIELTTKPSFHQMGKELARWKLHLQNHVKSEKQNKEIKYEIPRREIATIIKRTITLKLKESDLVQKYETSSVDKGL
jgi:hypothetical protein